MAIVLVLYFNGREDNTETEINPGGKPGIG
jgi:hypothetical protein